MAELNCKHPACNCKVEEGKGVSRGASVFCSDHCADAGTSAAEKCRCGHPGCQ